MIFVDNWNWYIAGKCFLYHFISKLASLKQGRGTTFFKQGLGLKTYQFILICIKEAHSFNFAEIVHNFSLLINKISILNYWYRLFNCGLDLYLLLLITFFWKIAPSNIEPFSALLLPVFAVPPRKLGLWKFTRITAILSFMPSYLLCCSSFFISFKSTVMLLF